MKGAAFVLFASMVCTSDAAAFQFGVCVHLAMARSDAATVLRLVDDAGFTSVRDDAYWSGVEKVRGTLEFPARYAESRKAMQALAQRGHSSVVILAYGNNIYDGGGFPTSADGIEAYSRYAGFITRTLRDSARQFEIWNEWNSGFGSRPAIKSGAAAAYLRVLVPAAAAIRAANPDAEVIGGATAGVDLAWLREFIAIGGLAHLDGVSVHSYTLFRNRINPEGAIHSLDRLHALLESAAPGRNIPIYVTEMGFPTNEGHHGVSESAAAKYLVRFMLLARSRPWVGGVWWYDLIDDGPSNSEAQHRFGLVRTNLAPKQAFVAARSVARLLAPGTAVKAFRSGAHGYLATGADGAGPWAMAWTLEPEFRGWDDGAPAQAVAPPEFAALVAQIPPDGSPVLFRKSGAAWRADESWQPMRIAFEDRPP
jgi:hypothetical protein